MLTSLLEADMEELERDSAQAYKEQMFFMRHPRLYAIYSKLYEWKVRLIAATICRWKGHDLVDDGSYATPDSGGEGFQCLRCGWSWWHQMY